MEVINENIEVMDTDNDIPIISSNEIIETIIISSNEVIETDNDIPIIYSNEIIETPIISSNEIIETPIISSKEVMETDNDIPIISSNEVIKTPIISSKKVINIHNTTPSKDIYMNFSNNIIETNKVNIDTPIKSSMDVVENNKKDIYTPKSNNDSIFTKFFNKKKINKDIDYNKKEMINSPNESPKIDANKNDVFIDIPIPFRSSSIARDVSADFVNINISQDTYNDKADKLLDLIKDNKKKITNNLYIISCKYDIIYYRYNTISLSLLIISTIITFIEAIRLTIINYDTQFKGSEISKYISQDTISLIINCISLSLSTILTILSSIARFKNYKENMDKLKVVHDTLFNYKNLYDKEKDLIHYYKINNELNYDIFKKIQDTIEDYNKEIKSINIFENIRNTDIIKFNNIKVNHDLRLHQLSSKREIELLRINKSTKKKKEDIKNNNTIGCYGFN